MKTLLMNAPLYACQLVVVLCLGIGACSGGSSNGVNYIINPNDVSINGCLSLEKLFQRTQAFPTTLQTRRFTSNVEVNAPGRPRYEAMLTKSNFQFIEGEFQGINEFYAGKQADCTHTAILNEAGQAEDFQIESSSATHLTLRRDESKTMTIRLLSPQSLEVSKDSQHLDWCNIENPSTIRVKFTYILKWGGPEIATSTEPVSVAMLKRISAAGAPMPPALEPLIAAEGSHAEVLAPVAELKALALTPGNPQEMACSDFSPGPAPTPDEGEEVEPTPTPAPTPNPSPEASPQEADDFHSRKKEKWF